jgi:hypothetical protein
LIIGGKGGLHPSEYRLKDMNRKRPPTEKELALDEIELMYEEPIHPFFIKLYTITNKEVKAPHFTYRSLCKNILS